jgi:hypothetical protein
VKNPSFSVASDRLEWKPSGARDPLFSAAPDRASVVPLPTGKRAGSLTVLAEEQLPAAPATTRPAEPASSCPMPPKVSFLHHGCPLSGCPKAGANSGKPRTRQVLQEHRRSATPILPSSHSTDSDGRGIAWSHEGFGMPIDPIPPWASFRPHKRCAAGTPSSSVSGTDRDDSEHAYWCSGRKYA